MAEGGADGVEVAARHRIPGRLKRRCLHAGVTNGTKLSPIRTRPCSCMGAWYRPIVAVQAGGVCWGQVTPGDQLDEGLAHGGGRQHDGLTMPGDGDDLRNSQITSVKRDRH